MICPMQFRLNLEAFLIFGKNENLQRRVEELSDRLFYWNFNAVRQKDLSNEELHIPFPHPLQSDKLKPNQNLIEHWFSLFHKCWFPSPWEVQKSLKMKIIFNCLDSFKTEIIFYNRFFFYSPAQPHPCELCSTLSFHKIFEAEKVLKFSEHCPW